MSILSWDLQALLNLVVLAGCAVVVGPLLHVVHRLICWYRVRRYAHAYLPHSMSHKPWSENTRGNR